MICAKIQKNRQYLSGAVQFTQTPAPTPAITPAITPAPKGKKCTVFSFRMGFLAIFPIFRLMKGKNRAILGFQQAFLLGLYSPQCHRGHSMPVLEIQRGQSAGSVFGDVAWNAARRGLTNTVASERICILPFCAMLFCCHAVLLPCCFAPHAAGLVAEGEGGMLLAPVA